MSTNNVLFVYGIFLNQTQRTAYGMSNPRYATIADYATFGEGIVQAFHIPNSNLGLTGLVVDVDPARWKELDRLESGYTRVKVKTNSGLECWMYVGKVR